MDFGDLNDNMIKGLISLLSVEQDIESIAYICGPGRWSKKSFMGFGELNDNMIKGLRSLLSVEQDIESIAYMY